MYGDRGSFDTIAKDMNSLLHSSTFEHPSDGEFAKIKELIPSNSYSNYNQHHDHNHNQNQNQNTNQNQIQNKQNQNRNQIQQGPSMGGQTKTSLMRYRSAPSSLFENLLDENDFFTPLDTLNHEPYDTFSGQQQPQTFQSNSHEFSHYAPSSTSMKLEVKEVGVQKPDQTRVSLDTRDCSSQKVSHLQHISNNNDSYNHSNHNSDTNSSSTFRSINSTSSNNLIRQSSSPAGFLSSLNSENGFASLRDVEKTISSSRLNNHISFSSGQSSSAMFLPQIPENGNEIKDSTFRSLKRTRDGDSVKLDKQNGESGHYTPTLIHHMSLPKTSLEMAVAEKYLRFGQDSIPCKIRAKRGCATHPRSIAERVRRTRISDRMKKLQELFPTIDKQTSTSDMLDMAVQYIKDIQNDLQTLKDARSRCSCSNKQLQNGSST